MLSKDGLRWIISVVYRLNGIHMVRILKNILSHWKDRPLGKVKYTLSTCVFRCTLFSEHFHRQRVWWCAGGASSRWLSVL